MIILYVAKGIVLNLILTIFDIQEALHKHYATGSTTIACSEGSTVDTDRRAPKFYTDMFPDSFGDAINCEGCERKSRATIKKDSKQESVGTCRDAWKFC